MAPGVLPIFLIAGIIELVTIVSFIFMVNSEIDFMLLFVVFFIFSVLSATLFLIGIRKNNQYQSNRK